VSTTGDQQLDFPVASQGQNSGPQRINMSTATLDSMHKTLRREINSCTINKARRKASANVVIMNRSKSSLRRAKKTVLSFFLKKLQILRTP